MQMSYILSKHKDDVAAYEKYMTHVSCRYTSTAAAQLHLLYQLSEHSSRLKLFFFDRFTGNENKE